MLRCFLVKWSGRSLAMHRTAVMFRLLLSSSPCGWRQKAYIQLMRPWHSIPRFLDWGRTGVSHASYFFHGCHVVGTQPRRGLVTTSFTYLLLLVCIFSTIYILFCHVLASCMVICFDFLSFLLANNTPALNCFALFYCACPWYINKVHTYVVHSQ